MENIKYNYNNITTQWGFKETENEILNQHFDQQNPIILHNNGHYLKIIDGEKTNKRSVQSQ